MRGVFVCEDVFVLSAELVVSYSNANAEFPFLVGLAGTPVYLLPGTPRAPARARPQKRPVTGGGHSHRCSDTHTQRLWSAFEATWLKCVCPQAGWQGVSAFRSPDMRGNNLLVR